MVMRKLQVSYLSCPSYSVYRVIMCTTRVWYVSVVCLCDQLVHVLVYVTVYTSLLTVYMQLQGQMTYSLT